MSVARVSWLHLDVGKECAGVCVFEGAVAFGDLHLITLAYVTIVACVEVRGVLQKIGRYVLVSLDRDLGSVFINAFQDALLFEKPREKLIGVMVVTGSFLGYSYVSQNSLCCNGNLTFA